MPPNSNANANKGTEQVPSLGKPDNPHEFDADAFWKWQNELYKKEVGDDEEALMWRPEADAPAPPPEPAPLPTSGPAGWTTATGQNLFEMLQGAVDEYDTRQAAGAEGKDKDKGEKKDKEKDVASAKKPKAEKEKEDKGKQGG